MSGSGTRRRSGTRSASMRRATLRRRTFIRTPPFHYTQSQERRAWTCMIYPHAEVFLKLPGSIPWHTWLYGAPPPRPYSYRYEHGANFNAIPYYALGGTVEELFNKMYKRDIPADEDLHVRTDPTGDLDIRICPLQVRNNTTGPRDTYYSEKYYRSPTATVVLQPYFEHCVNWLVDQIVAYFRPMETKLNQMFPHALPFVRDYDEYCKRAWRIERVGPLTIISTTVLQNVGSGYYFPLTKVQIKLTTYMPDIIARAATGGRDLFKYKKHIIQDHMVEMGFWEDPNGECEYQSFLYRPYNIRLRTLAGEVYGCYSGLRQRLEFLYEPEHIHKCVNYIYRLRFLLYIVHINYVKYNKKFKKSAPKNNNDWVGSPYENYRAGIPPETIAGIAETVQKLLNVIIKSLEGRRGIWFVYYEIVSYLREPILDHIDTDVIQRNLSTLTNQILGLMPDEEKDAIAASSGFRKGTKEYREKVLETYMNSIRARYIHPTPVKCNEVVPSELPALEEERKRRAALPAPRGPRLGELVAQEEHRGKPVFKLAEPDS
jgi:hypothetical protein